MRKKGKGAAYAILSAVLYGVSSVFTKTAASMGVTVSALLLLRGIIGMAIQLAYTTASRKSIRLARNNYRKVLILGLFGTSSTLILLNCAYLYLPVGTVTTIHFFYPVVVNFINALIYREKVPRITLFTMTVCTLAILLFFESFDESRVAGVVLTLFSVASWTFHLIYIEHSGLLSERQEALHHCGGRRDLGYTHRNFGVHGGRGGAPVYRCNCAFQQRICESVFAKGDRPRRSRYYCRSECVRADQQSAVRSDGPE